MAVLRMQRITICALKKDRKAILEILQHFGTLEVDHVIEEDQDFRKMDTAGQRMGFEKAAAAADQALDILDRYAPEKKSMLASLEGKKLISFEKGRAVQEERRELLKTARRIMELDREHGEQLAQIRKLENVIESLAPWMSLDVPVQRLETERTVMLPGTMPGGMTTERIEELLAEKTPEVTGADVHIISQEQNSVCLTVLCMKEDEAAVEEVLRSEGFARPSQMSGQVPARQKEELEKEIRECRTRAAELEKQIGELAVQREKLRITSDYYRVRADKYQVLGQLPQSRRTFVISGYIPQCQASRVADHLSEHYDCEVEVEDLKPDEEAPVILKNNPFSASMEGVVESYGLPANGEIDPTTIMSFFYVFFFGMMLSDAAYGLIVAVVCGILVRKYPRMSPGMRKSLKLFFYCGISTVVWGVLFGGYFGNIVDIVTEKFLGRTITPPALWFVPLDEPMKLLLFSLLFGVIHLFTGLAIKVLAASGAIGIVLMSGRSNRNPALRIALGAYDLYNITGWLSDVLSYSRLLALGLATGVIASVINQMGSMLPNNLIGILFFILIFIVGHSMNLAINLLGAYVHTNRLQFVEFFGKFYEGGGRPFRPFRENTKYTDIKEEKIS